MTKITFNLIDGKSVPHVWTMPKEPKLIESLSDIEASFYFAEEFRQYQQVIAHARENAVPVKEEFIWQVEKVIRKQYWNELNILPLQKFEADLTRDYDVDMEFEIVNECSDIARGRRKSFQYCLRVNCPKSECQFPVKVAIPKQTKEVEYKAPTNFENVRAIEPVKEEKEQLPKNVIGLDNPWPLQAVLTKLIESTNILLHDKDYDGQGYEEMEICVKRAKEIIKSITQPTESGEEKEIEQFKKDIKDREKSIANLKEHLSKVSSLEDRIKFLQGEKGDIKYKQFKKGILDLQSQLSKAQQRIKQLKESLGFLDISYNNTKILLESCERALYERDYKIKQLESVAQTNKRQTHEFLINELWSLWESMAECGELKIGPQFSAKYAQLKKLVMLKD